MLPVVWMAVKEVITTGSNYMQVGGFEEYSADLMGFFTPSSLNPLFKDFVSPIYANFSGNIAEHTVFAGYTVICLSLIAVIRIRKKEIRFWAVSALVFFLFCLGPFLHINGETSFSVSGYSFFIPLPYAVFMHIPVFSLARVPSRWDIMLMLSLAILAGYSLEYLFKNSPKNKLAFLFGLLILFEFLSVPITMSNGAIPAFYREISNESCNYAIVEVPLLWYAEPMYYQTSHGKSLVGGYVSRLPPYCLEFILNTPVIKDFVYFGAEDIVQQPYEDAYTSLLNFYKIKYIIIHKNMISIDQFNSSNNLLQRYLNQTPLFHENDSLVIFEVPAKPIGPFISLKSGWSGIESWNGTPTRWVNDDATIIVFSTDDHICRLNLRVMSSLNPIILNISLKNSSIYKEYVPENPVTIGIPIKLEKGINTIRFQSAVQCDKWRNKLWSDQDNPRCIGFGFQNISIVCPSCRREENAGSSLQAGR
jgi:hypothetical protein